MNWQKEAISDLNCYLARKNSILVMQEKIKELRAKEERLKSSGNTTPVQGGSSKSEDMIINCIIECDHLKENIIAISRWLALFERGLKTLTEDERVVLDKFYINRPTRHIDRLCDELHYEKTRIYEIKDIALRKFTLSRYGILEL